MGWFDNEQQGESTKPDTPQAPSRPAAKAPAPAPETGSTLGRQVHIDGTIVCDEDLTILGKVEGTIRGKGTLVIAKEADVLATIDGQRVLVHGKVDGNVHAADRVVLGQTARLTGDIEAPTLEIIEGAYFKGNVEMRPEKFAKAEPKAEKATTASSGGGKPATADVTSSSDGAGESTSALGPGSPSLPATEGAGAKAGQAATRG